MTDHNARTVAVDTSVAVPVLVLRHPDHVATSAWARDRDLVLCGHALPETFSVLTRLPADLAASPEQAAALIDARFRGSVQLHADDAASIHRRLSDAGIAGGAAYDALVALAAERHSLTLATRDIRALATYRSIGATVELIGSS